MSAPGKNEHSVWCPANCAVQPRSGCVPTCGMAEWKQTASSVWGHMKAASLEWDSLGPVTLMVPLFTAADLEISANAWSAVCPWLPPYLRQDLLLSDALCYRQGGAAASGASSISASILTTGALELQCTTVSDFMCSLEIWTRLFMLVLRELYILTHISPSKGS